MLDGSIASAVSSAAVAYTNGGVITRTGQVFVWGGRSWGGGFGLGSHNASLVEWSEGLGGVPGCYACEEIAVGAEHVMMLFKKCR